MPGKFGPLVFLTLLLSTPGLPRVTAAQTKRPAESRADSCDPARSGALVEQQASESEMIGDTPRRVAVMVRAAGLLWPHRRPAARTLFADAFDLASAHFREHGEASRTEQGHPDGKLLRELQRARGEGLTSSPRPPRARHKPAAAVASVLTPLAHDS